MKKTFTLICSLLFSVLCFAQKPQVVIMGAAETDYLEDVKTKLENTNRFSKVEFFNITDSTPIYSYVEKYDAVLLFTDYDASDPEALGDTLGKYIENGGGVVNTVFTNASAPIGGLFHQSYQVLEASNDQEDDTEYTLNPDFDSSHPLMSGVSTFNGGSSSFRSTSTTITTGSEIIAQWSDGAPLVIANEDMGPAHVRRVDLNFYPVSSDIRDDFWDSSTDGATIIANALVYVSKQVTTIKKPSSVSISDIYPNPSSGKFSIPLNSKATNTYQVKILTLFGTEVFSAEQSLSIGLNILDMNLALDKGIYVVEVIDNNSSVSKKIVIE